MVEVKEKGKIEVIAGPMFSGKSEELLRRVNRAEIATQRVQLFTHVADDRYGVGFIASHNGSKREALAVSQASQILEKLDPRADLVVIDEGQFFGEALMEVARTISNLGIRVIVAALDMDFRGEPWRIGNLLSIAGKIDKLTAICAVCFEEATMTQRLVNGKPAHYQDPIVLVGAKEDYQARCRDCHVVLRNNGSSSPLFLDKREEVVQTV